jgi:methylmalonyl-CoA/ethylmalonyl-CoA epimerase
LLLEEQAPKSLLYFLVEDVDLFVESIRARGVEVETEPHVIFHDEDGLFGEAGIEERMAFIRDSEANLVGLMSRHLR